MYKYIIGIIIIIIILITIFTFIYIYIYIQRNNKYDGGEITLNTLSDIIDGRIVFANTLDNKYNILYLIILF